MAKIALSAENMEFLKVIEENRKELEQASGLAILFTEWLLKEGWCSYTDRDVIPSPPPIWRKTEWAGFYYVYPESTTPKLYEEFIKNQIKCQN